MTHALKTWPEYFKKVESGEKLFEVRKDDRKFQVGDKLILQEYNPEQKQYTGKEWEGHITYLLSGGNFGIKKGYVVMAIKEKEQFA